MILIDREDVIRVGIDTRSSFLVDWDPDDPVSWAEGQALDFPEILAEGPFLLVVHNEWAWAGQELRNLQPVAGRKIDPPNFERWKYLADLYAEEMGISRQGLLLRFASIERRLYKTGSGGWFPWEQFYHWPEGSDLAWSALAHGQHDEMQARKHEGQLQVRHW